MRRSLLCLLFAAGPLAAQEATNPWRISDFPYLMGDPTNGLLIIGHIQYSKEADYDSRVPYEGYLGLEAAWGTRGSRFAVLKYRAPRLLNGWRFSFDGGAVREGKFGYYGQGPDGQGGFVDLDMPTNFFRVHRTRYYGRAEVTRRIYKQVHVAVAGGVVRYSYAPLSDGDAFRTDFFDEPVTGTDATGRIALVLDTRNNELVPTKGLLLEGGLYAGSGKFEQRNLSSGGGGPVSSFSGSGYTGAYAHLRGYVSPRAGTILAGRLAMRGLSGNAPLDARYVLPSWEREVTVYGGVDSHRSFVRGRFVGRGVLMSSLDVRHTLIDVGDYGSVTILAFLDAGKAFEGSPSLTFSGWKVGGGGGLGLKVIRSALLTFNFAVGPDGFTFSMGNGWAF
ncbi:MAG TPA: BamA/TamA family outer membrane protein [Gemmatimonadales bacterium]|jgi:outer membrane protein assembly factor BamA